MKLNKVMEEILIKSTLDVLENEARQEGISLVEKLQRFIPLDPVKTGVDKVNGYILDQYGCPTCERPIGDEMMRFNYCPGCGQKVKEI